MTRKNKPVGEDDLTAYVDGELPDERRAFVEQWLTQHPAEQRQILANHYLVLFLKYQVILTAL